ncbi:transposase [Lysinibacillus sp. GbtcB16]|uniref:transposase n=1 Tax=Lysinibacillus sp. GbtcB16 TaxID=2824761 RepID=UPI001C2F242A|nr:transposase [Lysinibacillus sp. GbtcB16]
MTRYNDSFTKSVVQQYINGKSKTEILREHGMSKQTLNEWINKFLPQLVSEYKLSNEQIKKYEDENDFLKKENIFLKETLIKVLEMKK